MSNAIIGQSGGPTAAINATLAGVISQCLEEKKIDNVYGMKNGIEGLEKKELILLNGYFKNSPMSLELLCSTPAAALGSCRKKVSSEEQIENLYKVFDEYDIGYFFYIGGNDSMDTIKALSEYAESNKGKVRDVRFIGVPKTIDNDLCLTDHTPGFGSAAKYIACSIQEIVRDCAVYKTKAVTIVEIMGRDAGWLTAASAIPNEICSAGPDLIYLPECDFSEEDFLNDINRLFETKESPYVIVAVSEGIRNSEGKYVAEAAMSGVSDAFGHKYLSGTGKYLENLVRDKIGCKVRSVELNILQRCASHISSKCDIDESVEIGKAAVKKAISGESGKMIAFRRVKKSKEYQVKFFAEDVKEIANKIKKVPASYINEAKNGVTKECVDYILPLIQGEAKVFYEDGIPVHFEF